MAEAELAVLSSQCLDRRIGDQQALAREVEAWQIRRNTYNAKADWRFTIRHHNTHLAMSLKGRGFVDRDAVPWGILRWILCG